MKLKSILIITVLIITIMTATGLYYKSSYLNYNNEEFPLENFVTGVMNEELLDAQLKKYDNELDSSNYIIAVTCQEKSFFRYSCTTQKVKIEHVFKGNNIKKGDIIEIAKSDSEIFNSDEMKINGRNCINMGFVNEMKPGYTYLVFLDKKINTHDENTVIYITDDFIMSPIFCYSDIENNPCTTISDFNLSAWYGDIKDNEFFISSENAIKKMEDYKENLLSKYSCVLPN